jgi:branched-chain amino acid aminotransferase
VIVYLNGEWLPENEADIPITDRGFLYGDGVFETARLHQGKFFRLEQHLERLQQSALALQIPAPPSAQLATLAREIAERNQLQEASLRITLTRGSVAGKSLHTERPTLLVTIAAVGEDWLARAAQGWTLITARTRRPAPAAVPAQLKSLGRIYSLLATLEIQGRADDALLLTTEGAIAEGPTWNFFWRHGRVVRTAALELGVLDGVTRAIIMELARAAGYEVQEGRWSRSDLDHAEEAFATMTSRGIVPIRSLDGRPFPSTDCAAQLQPRYWEQVAAELRASSSS